MAKNQNTFAKRQREMEKRAKQDAKRIKREERKNSDEPTEEIAAYSPASGDPVPEDDPFGPTS